MERTSPTTAPPVEPPPTPEHDDDATAGGSNCFSSFLVQEKTSSGGGETSERGHRAGKGCKSPGDGSCRSPHRAARGPLPDRLPVLRRLPPNPRRERLPCVRYGRRGRALLRGGGRGFVALDRRGGQGVPCGRGGQRGGRVAVARCDPATERLPSGEKMLWCLVDFPAGGGVGCVKHRGASFCFLCWLFFRAGMRCGTPATRTNVPFLARLTLAVHKRHLTVFLFPTSACSSGVAIYRMG